MHLKHSFKTRFGGSFGSRFGFRILTGSSGSRVNLKKNQNNVVLIKKTKQKSTGYNRILPGSPSHIGFFLSLFFLQPSLVLVPGRLTGPSQFQNYDLNNKRLVNDMFCPCTFFHGHCSCTIIYR
jgi:hypothetical protein